MGVLKRPGYTGEGSSINGESEYSNTSDTLEATLYKLKEKKSTICLIMWAYNDISGRSRRRARIKGGRKKKKNCTRTPRDSTWASTMIGDEKRCSPSEILEAAVAKTANDNTVTQVGSRARESTGRGWAWPTLEEKNGGGHSTASMKGGRTEDSRNTRKVPRPCFSKRATTESIKN